MPASNETMKAWQYNEGGPVIEDILFLNNQAARPARVPGEDEVLIQVISAALNPVDYKVIEIALLRRIAAPFQKPATPGLDFCGRVIATGSGIDTLVNGTLVFGRTSKPVQHGSLGEYMLVRAIDCVEAPKEVEPDHLAALGTAALTAYQCIAPNVSSGNKVFINGGSGGCGLWGIQIAKALGCFVAVSCSTSSTSICKEAGADEIINYSATNVSEELKSKGATYDLVVDNVGRPDDLFHAADHYLKPNGKFVQIAASENAASLGRVADRFLRPSFLGGGKSKYQFLSASNDPAAMKQLGEWVGQGKLKAFIDSTYQFEDVPKAFSKLKGGHTKGKIVIHVGA